MHSSKPNHWKFLSLALIGVILLMVAGYIVQARAVPREHTAQDLQQFALTTLGYVEFDGDKGFKIADNLKDEYKYFLMFNRASIPETADKYPDKFAYIYDLDTKTISFSTLDSSVESDLNQFNNSLDEKFSIAALTSKPSTSITTLGDLLFQNDTYSTNYLVTTQTLSRTNTHKYLMVAAQAY